MLFLHETHHVKGRFEDDFEAAVREGWMRRLAEGDEARLLWYANQAHGIPTVLARLYPRRSVGAARSPGTARRRTVLIGRPCVRCVCVCCECT